MPKRQDLRCRVGPEMGQLLKSTQSSHPLVGKTEYQCKLERQ